MDIIKILKAYYQRKTKRQWKRFVNKTIKEFKQEQKKQSEIYD